MELKEFIKAAINDITDAVSELQAELHNDAVVSPPMPYPIALKTIKQDGKDRLISNIDFEVSVTVGNTDTCEGHAKAGIQIFSARISGGNEERSENVSRLSFSIPVLYPTAEFKTDAERAVESAREIVQKHKPDRATPFQLSVDNPLEDSDQPSQPIPSA